MTFGTRLTLSLVAPLVLLIIGFGYFDEQRTRRHFREELRREGRVIARTVQLAMEDALRDRNFEDVRQLVDQITGFERVYGLRLFTPDGRLFHQSAVLEQQPFLSTEVLQEVLATRQPGERQRQIGDQQVLSFIVPLSAPDGSLYGALQLLQLESFIDEEVRSARNSIAILTLIMVLVTGGIIILVSRFVVSRPIGEFVSRIRAIEPQDSWVQVPIAGGDELKKLAREFNALWKRLADSHESLLAEQEERRRAEVRLRNAERLAAIGQLAAGLAHEIGTPLNVIGGRTDALMRRKIDDPAIERSLRIISEQINRIARIVREMLEFAQVKEITPTPVDLAELVNSVVEFLEQRIDERQVTVQVRTPEGLPPMIVDRDQMYEVFLNLVLNAIDSMAPGGVLAISAAKIVRVHPENGGEAAEYLHSRLRDTGTGIRPEDLKRIFDPFFTTKAVGKGSGLGMSVAYGIIKEHGGWMEVDSELGRGTDVDLFLPVELRGSRKPQPATAEP